MADFEKLGVFYLGKQLDAPGEPPYLYDSKDLTTHAVCVGMTGSGKTGLCLSLLEEAAIDGIPAIAIDPKGDLGNLLLAFPELRPADFRPWIDEREAERKGLSPDDYAAETARTWSDGLAQWGQDGARIARFRDAAEAVIYTPGSSAGVPVTVLRSFAAPPRALIEDADALRERVASAASGLLTLLGVDADPVKSREHILLSTILDHAWRGGRDLDLAGLIRAIQQPPVERIGVMDVESFFPAKERGELALRLNNLLASPSFAGWLEGVPLDVADLLYTPEGRPRLAIFSIAHLSDAERMFFVTLLLNEVLAWARAQPGTSSLRALLYMDEVFGFLPPTANPPSKVPMLTLLKQARAYGLGVVLATQNPVDLDYKGLSNAGTWFLGRLQTERDQARVLDGLEGASSAAQSTFDRKAVETTLAGLASRQFLVHNVHEEQPVRMHTRWALSYLAGPLTRAQIQKLMEGRRATAAPRREPATEPAAAVPERDERDERPILPPEIPQVFLPWDGAGERPHYRPMVYARARLHFVRASLGLDEWREWAVLAPLSGTPAVPDWDAAEFLEVDAVEPESEPEAGAAYAELPAAAARAASWKRWQKSLTAWLYREREMPFWRSKSPKLVSRPGESERDFRLRLQQSLREARDEQLDELREKHAARYARLEERIRKAEARIGREQSQYESQKTQTAISVGAAILGAFMGRKKVSATNIGRATTAVRGAGRAARDRGDIDRARADLEALIAKRAELEGKLEATVDEVDQPVDPVSLELESVAVRPRKSDIGIEPFALAWAPRDADA